MFNLFFNLLARRKKLRIFAPSNKMKIVHYLMALLEHPEDQNRVQK
jgi:hypothetical protein